LACEKRLAEHCSVEIELFFGNIDAVRVSWATVRSRAAKELFDSLLYLVALFPLCGWLWWIDFFGKRILFLGTRCCETLNQQAYTLLLFRAFSFGTSVVFEK
jgi:hypothetical protein